MTPTDKEIVEEARKRRHAAGYGLGANLGLPPLDHYIIEVVREGWTPPEPVVDPDIAAYLMEFREWAASRSKRLGLPINATANLQRHLERERAKVLLRGLENIVDADQDAISEMARVALAKYEEGGR